MDDQDKLSVLEQVSLKQGGGGVALKGNTNLTQVGVPISLGKTAGPGTGCVIFLGTNRDAAYNDCVLSFYVMIQGREVLFGTFTVDAAHVAANTNIEHRLTGCAAESWEVRITLFATVPAAPLQTSIMAFGVENIQGTNPLFLRPSFEYLYFSQTGDLPSESETGYMHHNGFFVS